MAATILDPVTWFMMYGSNTAVKGLRAAGTIGEKTLAAKVVEYGVTGAAETATAETLLHSQQETRTLQESMLNTGMALMLGGVLGASAVGVNKYVKPFINEKMNPTVNNLTHGSTQALDYAKQANEVLAKDIDAEFKSAGAAAVKKDIARAEASSEALEVAGEATKKLAAAHKWHNPLLRTIHSPFKNIRNAGSVLVENCFVTQRNYTGDTVKGIQAGIEKSELNNIRIDLDDVEVKALDDAAEIEYKQKLEAAKEEAIEVVKKDKRLKKPESIEKRTKEVIKKISRCCP